MRSRRCGSAGSVRWGTTAVAARPATETKRQGWGTAALAVGAAGTAAWRLGWGWATPGLAVWAAGLGWLACSDLRRFVLPKRLVYSTLALTLAGLVAAAGVAGDWRRLAVAVVTGLALEGVFSMWALLLPGSLGFGDVRLVGLVGLGTGWLSPGLAVGAVIGGLVLAAAVGAAGATAGWWSWRQRLPLGTFLSVAAVATFFVRP